MDVFGSIRIDVGSEYLFFLNMTPRIINWEAEPEKKQREMIDRLLEENDPEKIADEMEREMYPLNWEERRLH